MSRVDITSTFRFCVLCGALSGDFGTHRCFLRIDCRPSWQVSLVIPTPRTPLSCHVGPRLGAQAVELASKTTMFQQQLASPPPIMIERCVSYRHDCATCSVLIISPCACTHLGVCLRLALLCLDPGSSPLFVFSYPTANHGLLPSELQVLPDGTDSRSRCVRQQIICRKAKNLPFELDRMACNDHGLHFLRHCILCNSRDGAFPFDTIFYDWLTNFSATGHVMPVEAMYRSTADI